MKYKVIISLILFLSMPMPAAALIPLSVNQGGTGDNTITGIPYGTGTAPLSIVNIGSGLNFSAGTLTASGSGGTVTSFAFTNGAGFTGTVSDATTTPTLSLVLQNATTSQSGQLTSTDWNTFNNKQAAGNYITALTGDITASGPGLSTATLTTVNGNVGSFTNSSITVNAKGLITAASSGSTPEVPLTFSAPLVRTVNTISIPVATGSVNGYLSSTDWTTFNGKGTGTVTNVSGTTNRITSTGGATPVIDISASYVGQASITTLGTIGTGTWTGTTIAIANGGTGQTTANTAFNALAPSQTGNSGKFLTTDGSNTSWATVSGGSGITIGTTTITSGTNTRVLFDDSAVVGESANFTFDKTNQLLSIGKKIQVGNSSSVSTATPTELNMGGTYADSVTSTKAKWKLYDDGTAANNYAIGITAGQFNFFKSANGSFNFYFNDVLYHSLSGVSTTASNFNSPLILSPAGAYLKIGTTTSTSTATPVYMDLGGTYADSVTSSKAKWKLYNDGTDANTYGIGISAGQFNFFKSTGGTYNWHFNDVEKMQLTGNGFLGIGTTSPTNILSLGGQSAQIFWMERQITGNTAGNNLTVQAGGATTGATNKAGGNLILAAGLSTGTGNNQILFQTSTPGSTGTADNALATRLTLDSTALASTVPIRLKGYTVATLPAGTQGDTAYCTDLLLPAFFAVVTGGGAVVGPVFYNGTQWISI